MMKMILLSAALALCVPSAVAADTYVQDFGSGLHGDGFVEALATPPDDPWQARVEDGVYVLENADARGAVRYFDFRRVRPDGAEALQVEASVEVGGDLAGEAAAAGLLARYDPQTRTYYAFVRTAHGVALYKRDQDGFSRLVNLEGPVRAGDGPVTLTVSLTPQGTRLLVEGHPIGTISSADITGGRFGIVAIDRGTFRFDDFTVTTR